jgi:uncharacterized protein YjdB
VKIIGDGAFQFCSLTSVTIPSSVETIENEVFTSCSNLTDITINWTTPLTIDGTGVITSACTLHVPVGTKALYQADPVWGTFGTIVDDVVLPVAVTDISLDNTSVSMQVNESQQLTATVAPNNATNQNISWRSSDETVATVDDTGLITAVGEGTVTITVATEDGDFSATCIVTVNPASPPTITVTGISLDNTSLSMWVNETQQLIATIEPSDATNQNVSWSSSDESVASVDGAGLITAVGEGTATITATTEDGNFSATCIVTANPVEPATINVTGISLDKTSASIWIGETEQLTATIEPNDATNQNVSWVSSVPSVATISNTGLITAVSKGTTTITATTEEGGFTASCAVNVSQQEVTVPDSTQTGTDGKGTIVLSLTIPADVLFSGSFKLRLPNGVQLDLSVTHLVGDLASQLSLNIVQEVDGSWTFTITPQALRSAKEMVYSQIMNIGYIVDETVAKGTYEAAISDLSFLFDNGTSVIQSELPVQLTVTSPTGIPELNTETGAYLYNDRLYVKNPVAETIQVYSVNGVLLYNFQKPAGAADYLISNAPGSVLIVKGSSGWVKKVIR